MNSLITFYILVYQNTFISLSLPSLLPLQLHPIVKQKRWKKSLRIVGDNLMLKKNTSIDYYSVKYGANNENKWSKKFSLKENLFSLQFFIFIHSGLMCFCSLYIFLLLLLFLQPTYEVLSKRKKFCR